MSKVQAQIIALMSQLPLAERRELVEHIYDSNLFDDSVFDRLSDVQKVRLAESVSQAERADVIPADTLFAELAEKHGFSRA